METITNAATAAARAVWGEGETRKEPVSGVSGDTAKGEPYDAGNLDTPAQEKAEENYNEHGLGREAAATKPTSIEAAAPGVQSKDTTAGQNDTRDPERVARENEKNTDLKDVDNTSDGTDAKLAEGPGPRPVESVAKENGGDAGQVKAHEGSSEAPREVGSEGATASSSKSENQPDPAENEYVHATGFAADGGDFDATKPGAGREADRLMEQKGVHLGEEGSSSGSNSHESHSHSHSHSDKKDKPSIGERIKAKLHKH